MARRSQPLRIEYSLLSTADLGEIWEWNAKRDGKEHADRYVAFLKSETESLCWEDDPGQFVAGSQTLRMTLIRRRPKGYGHLVVFTVVAETLNIVRFFHTSQDWQGGVASLISD